MRAAPRGVNKEILFTFEICSNWYSAQKHVFAVVLVSAAISTLKVTHNPILWPNKQQIRCRAKDFISPMHFGPAMWQFLDSVAECGADVFRLVTANREGGRLRHSLCFVTLQNNRCRSPTRENSVQMRVSAGLIPAVVMCRATSSLLTDEKGVGLRRQPREGSAAEPAPVGHL
jgi:hypothetical protein